MKIIFIRSQKKIQIKLAIESQEPIYICTHHNFRAPFQFPSGHYYEAQYYFAYYLTFSTFSMLNRVHKFMN